jgi:glycosyltransferase involved in cell wall biosynthesis
MSSADLEIAFDLTTSVHAGKRSAGMSRVENALALALGRVHTGPLRHLAWDATTGTLVDVPTHGGRSDAVRADAGTRRVLLVTGGGWMSNAPYLHALRRWRDANRASLVAVVHDVLPIIRPHWFAARESGRNSANIAAMLRLANGILTYSTSTSDDLAAATRRLHLSAIDTRRITLGIEMSVAAPAAVPAPLAGLQDRPFVLFVSTITFRKRHEFLCDVWRSLVRTMGPRVPRLLLIGRTAPDGAAVADRIGRDRELRGHVVHLDNVDDEALAWCYEHCLFTAYPSLYEGWGLPVSESLAHGKVCVAADTSSLREAAAGVSPLLDPYDHAAWCRSVEQLASQPEALAAREAAVRAHRSLPTWNDAARSVLAALVAPFAARTGMPAAGLDDLLTWRDGCDAGGSTIRLGRDARFGVLIDDAMRDAGVAISATTSSPVTGALAFAIGGIPAATWDVGPAATREALHVPPLSLVERAVLDVETTVTTDRTSNEAAPTVTLTEVSFRPLSDEERATAVAHQRIGWTIGDVLAFGSGQRGLLLLQDGWNTPAHWGVWSEGPAPQLTFAPLPAGSRVLYLRTWARAFVMPQAPSLSVDVLVDGDVVDTWHFRHPQDERPVERMVAFAATGRPVTVTFRIPDCRSPESLGLGTDTRRLGFGLMCAQLTATRPTPGDRPWRVRDALS